MKRIGATAALTSATAAGDPPMLEWPYVGAEQSHTKYSAADEVTTANVGELDIVWRWEPNEAPRQ